ncbi:MAG: hypothetical protein IPN59_08400 [Holophaga sp.]|nr:hypothetical protein [Holophaga sp.]
MNKENRSEMVSRDTILKMLSKDETGSVSTAETALSLPKGSEYIDLSRLDCGIQNANGNAIVMGHILSRKSVHKDTWAKIVAEVTAHDLPKVKA